MSGLNFAIRLDDSDFIRWGAQLPGAIDRNLRSSVDKSARYGRAVAVKMMAKDSGVPLKRFRKAVPLVQASRGGGPTYTATWAIGKSDNSVRLLSGGKPVRGVPLKAGSYFVSGGGSTSLDLPHGFVLSANGGTVVMNRFAKGKDGIRPVYAERPNVGMQGGRAPLKAWEQGVASSLPDLVSSGVQAALSASTFTPSAKFYSADAE